MTDAKTDQEPTMEEILASIRRIISEDDPEGAAAPAEATEPEAPQGDVDEPVEDDVLELTEVADEPEPEPEAEDGSNLEFGEDEPEAEPEPEPEPETPMEDVVMDDDDGLLSDIAASATTSAFAGLSAALGSTRIEGRTMEDIVKELLRPMLKEWLDDNLPSLVDQIVREEVERLSRRR